MQEKDKIRVSLKKNAILALEDGTCFKGYSNSQNTVICGEVVFNTAHTGYQEVCTDPSYAHQIILFTSSHIGNTGVNDVDGESDNIWVKGVIAHEISESASSWRATNSFRNFLFRSHVPWIEGIDTRKLTRHLQKNGSLKGCLAVGEIDPKKAIESAASHTLDAHNVFLKSKYRFRHDFWEKSRKIRICVLDFGVKRNILKELDKFHCDLKVVPGHITPSELMSFEPEGIVFSNGPGDPNLASKEIEYARQLIQSKTPILGICFGHQIIGLAFGCQVEKMKYGHHGINHPVFDCSRKKVFITSQNHNYSISTSNFPSDLEVTHVSLFDQSIQGIRSKKFPVIGFQGHPEGSPGPQDIDHLFADFFQLVQVHRKVYASQP